MNVSRKITNVLRIPSKRARRQAINHVADQADRLRVQAAALVMEISQARTAKRLSLHMSPAMIRVGWAVVLFFHVFNAVYSCSLAYIYHYMASPDMDYYVQVLRMMPQENYNGVIALYGCIGAMNFYSALKMSIYSLYYRRVVFGKLTEVGTEKEYPNDGIENEGVDNLSTRFRLLKRFVSGFARAISARGEWFDIVLLMREVIEISSQTVQAYSSSLLISSVWMNQVFAGLIFLNTIANTLVHHHLENKVGLRRLYSSVIDLALDFAWGFIIPCKIIFVYILLFIKNKGSFPDEFNYSDTLQIKAILECNQFFMVTWWDAVTTTLPYLNMLSGLRSVKFLIQHDMEVVRVLSSTKVQPIGPAVHLARVGDTVVPDATQLPARASATVVDCEEILVESKRTICSRRLTSFIAALMPLCGVFVLLTSITSSGILFGNEDSCAAGCKLRMHPWFTRRCACSVLEVNCYERGITGRESEVQSILQSLDARVLNSLIISHCPELVVTEDIRRFSNLLTLEIYNSTVVEWSASASLSLPYVPFLVTLYIVRSQLVGGMPQGLTTDLSPNIVDIEFVACDLGGPLPSDLDEKWPSVVMLYLEHCGLQEFPLAMANMELTDLSLADNNISVLPESLSDSSIYVMLDRNPLDRIPDGFASMTDLLYLTVQFTNISSLPPWLLDLQADDASLRFRALGTPYCRELPPESREAEFASCTLDDYSNGIFPLAMRDETRAIR
ncbi:unnamed protein product [Phytophthora lilii]|uniref:Unnamed protein product n=1 Tax=Phytophthora lilii TaxID=2077276 RepID=A0A9W6TZU4_9STRA|nr:unnamed protein product [Phytophthora lilii]